MPRPLLLFAAFLAAGAVAGDELTRHEALLLVALSVAAVGLGAAASSPAAALALAASTFGLGASAAALERLEYERTPLRAWVAGNGEPRLAKIEGVAVEDAALKDGDLVLRLDVARADIAGRSVALTGRARLRVGGEATRPEVRAGSVVSMWAEMRAPRGYANPGSLDLAALARRDGLHAMGFCKSVRLMEVRRGEPPPWWREAPRVARRWARGVLLAALPEGQERAIVLAMTLGDPSEIEDETAERFRIAGTYHVLALSGAQVALLAGALVLVLRRLRLGPAAQAAILTPSLVFYAALVGGEVPIVRATVMALVALWGRAADLDVDLANLLGLTAAALLWLQPSAVHDVGFELSFAATLGIVLLTPILVAALPRLPGRLELSLAASLASQLALWPLLASRFHRLAPAALLLNLAAVPLSGGVLLAGLAMLAAALVSRTLAQWIAPIAWLLARGLLWTGELAAQWPGIDVRTPGVSVTALLVYAAGVCALFVPGRRRRGAAWIASGIMLMQWPAPPADGRLHLTVLDVGQGDALVVRTPSGRAWVVDAGGTATGFDIGESVVAPYLWSLPIRRLEGMTATHSHIDHVGGARFLLRQFAPRELWEGPAPRADPTYARFAAAARQTPTRWKSVQPGTAVTIDGVRLEVLGPNPPARLSARTRNDDSVVLRVTLGTVSFLLTGDIESAAELSMNAGPVAVVKVPHHGSRTSSSEHFLDRTAPKVALLSVGARNRFGHPHAEVLARYAVRGIRVYRTDRDGAVTVSTDGTTVWVGTFRGGVVERIRP